MAEKKKPSAHIPQVTEVKTSRWHKFLKNLFFDCVIMFAQTVVYIFFREVSVRGSFNVPKTGSTIVVVAPHANQFVDGAIIMTQIRALTNRNSPPIIAESSYKKKFIGFLAKLASAIPVPRAQDNLKFIEGEIFAKDGDYQRIYGSGTKFTKLEPKALIGLPESAGNAEISEIISDTELVLKKGFKSDRAHELLDAGSRFKYANKISNDVTFQHVFNALNQGGIITIFPEGGSHDRLELLPIKAGFAIMALGAVSADPSKPVNIVPTGLNYFHRNRFRSRAVVEFGQAIQVTAEDGEFYRSNPREAVAKLLDEVTTSLKSVTLTAPDYETLMVIQAARRLYANKLPLSLVVDMNRKLITGYTHYKDDPRIMQLKENVLDYNKRIHNLGLKDHQVELATQSRFVGFGILIYRLVKLTFFGALSLPGSFLFFPVFYLTSRISKKKQAEALAASVVKIKAVDVVATWKIIIATMFAPALYISYSLIGVIVTKKYNLLEFGTYHPVSLFVIIYDILVTTTYAAFRIGEVGSDILKSLPPLFLGIFGSEKELNDLKKTRRDLQLEITDVVNSLGPKVFPDFDKFTNKYAEINKKHNGKEEFTHRGRADIRQSEQEHNERQRSVSATSTISTISNGLSRVNSEGYLSDIPILGDGGSSGEYCPPTSGDFDKLEGENGITTGANVTEASAKLRKAMKERLENKQGA